VKNVVWKLIIITLLITSHLLLFLPRMKEEITPYLKEDIGKKEQVAEMFDNISGSYDFLNHFLSMGIDTIWRKNAIDQLKGIQPKIMLDVATGTGDFALMANKRLEPDLITGIDFSEGMLKVGLKKMKAKGLSEKIHLQYGDSEKMPFDDNRFDAITVAYGVRNFEDLSAGLKEMYRVLQKGGKTIILEFSNPKKFPVKQAFNMYFKYILPTIGKMVSKDNRAYTYLPESVKAFPEGEEFLKIFRKAGFKNCKQISLTGGITSIYIGEK
jgi:demethylmenaquinone methyltransferase/2-methoxy-6-polyprenyl-1,4-benzoquinol methylase